MTKRISLSSIFGFTCSILLLAGLNVNPALSQDVKPGKDFKYKLSTPYKVIDATDKVYFHEGNTILSLKYTTKEFHIQKFDIKTMKEVSMREVTDLPDNFVDEGFVQVEGKVIFFYSLWDKKNETEQLFAREIEFEKGAFGPKPTLLLSVKGKVTGTIEKTSMYGMRVSDKFNFDTSFDTTKLVVRYRKKPETKDDAKSYDIIGMNVFTRTATGLEKMWSKEIKMPYTEQQMDELDYTVDSKGNTYLLAKVNLYEGDSKKKREKDEEGHELYKMELIKVDAATQALSILKIDLAEKFIQDLGMTELKDNVLSIIGYYNKGLKKQNGTDGLFLSTLNANGELANIKSYDIPLEIVNQNVSKKEAEKNTKKEEEGDEGEAQLHYMTFDSFKRNTDGSLIVNGEQYHMVVHTTRSSNGSVHTYYTYHYGAILSTKINADGSLAWMRKLPKRQDGVRGIGGMSFKFIESDSNYYYMYLDNYKNINLPSDQAPKSWKDDSEGFLTTYKINKASGAVSKVAIFDTRNVGGTQVYQFNTSRIFKVTPTDFMVELYKKGKEDVMIKLSFTEYANKL